MEEINGIVVLNKPTGMNSMKAVKQVQHKLGAKKAGHLGTLDPMGTGVLLIALGKATKLFESHLKVTKTYRAVFKFGIETETFVFRFHPNYLCLSIPLHVQWPANPALKIHIRATHSTYDMNIRQSNVVVPVVIL